MMLYLNHTGGEEKCLVKNDKDFMANIGKEDMKILWTLKNNLSPIDTNRISKFTNQRISEVIKCIVSALNVIKSGNPKL